MEALRTHVAGIDVHKEILAITILIGKADQKPEVIQFECKTFSEDLTDLPPSKMLRGELSH